MAKNPKFSASSQVISKKQKKGPHFANIRGFGRLAALPSFFRPAPFWSTKHGKPKHSKMINEVVFLSFAAIWLLKVTSIPKL